MTDFDPQADEALAFTVASVWREFRVSCPHPDVLRAARLGGLPEDASEFVRFHLEESSCPFCCAVVQEFDALDEDAARPDAADLDSAKERVLRSTMTFLRRVDD
jgi:hypothetical protein